MAGPAILVYGNCQAAPLCQILRHIPAFSGYEVLSVRWLDREQGRPERFLPELKPERMVLLLAAKITRDGLPEWLIAALPDGVPVIRTAALETRLPWPFLCRDPLNRPAPDFPFGRHSYGDSFLIKLRDEGLRGDALFDAYMEQAPAHIDANLPLWQKQEAARIAARDARLDVTASDLLADKQDARRSFHTPNHPTGWLLRQYAARVVRAVGAGLGLEVVDAEDTIETRMRGFDPLGHEELPVHPILARRLQLGWWTPGQTYRTPHGVMTFRQHLRHYAHDFADG